MEQQLIDDYSHGEVALLWTIFAILTFLIVHNYAYKSTPWYVYVSVFIGWLFPFSTVVLLPLDLSSSLYRECVAAVAGGSANGTSIITENVCDKPFLYVSEDFLFYSWKSIYWTMFILTFLIIPFVQSYCDSGYFTFAEKAKKSIRANVMYYVVMGALGMVAVVWVIATNRLNQREALLRFAMSMANIFGLSLLVVFLSFGLIQVPRSLWQASNKQRALRYLEHLAPEVKEALDNSKKAYQEVVDEILHISSQMTSSDPLRPYVDVVVQKCPLDHVASAGSSSRRAGTINMNRLTDVHKNVIRLARDKEKYEWEWEHLCKSAFHLQDVLSNQKSADMKFRSSSKSEAALPLNDLLMFVKWVWYVKLESVFYKSLSVFFGVLSAIILWSETTYLIKSPLMSVFGNIYHAKGVSYAFIELLSTLSMFYMCACSMHSLFRIKVFSMYSLHPNHHSSEVSLCWFTNYMCRLTFPLGYNFMYMASSTNTVLFNVMGEMVGEDIQTFVPILVSVIFVMNTFDVLGRIMRCMGLEDNFLDSGNHEDLGWDDVEEGRMLISEARDRSGLAAVSSPSTNDLMARAAEANEEAQPLVVPKSSRQTDYGTSRSGSGKWNAGETNSKYLLNNPLYEKYQKKRQDPSLASGYRRDDKEPAGDVSPRSWGATVTANNNVSSSSSSSAGRQQKGAKDKPLVDFNNIWK